MPAQHTRALPAVALSFVRALLVPALVASTTVVLASLTAPPASAAGPCDAPVVNRTACENTKQGTTDWMVTYRDEAILGYTADISTTPGGRVDFKVNTAATSYEIDVFRLGHYGGAGARYLDTVTRGTPQNQPACLREAGSALIDCGNWAVSASWTVPSDAVSGIYYGRIRRTDLPADAEPVESEIVWVVRDDTSTSKVLFQTSDSTWVAYNRYGGNSLYFGDGPGQGGQAYKVSYNRPHTGGDGEDNFIFNAEVPMLRFMEANGYDMSYTTDVDSARRGHLIKNHDVFMAVGHDEYWSQEQRDNVEAARDAGVHLAFLTGNEIFWKTRWEKSKDVSATDWRTLVCYKETKGSQTDPDPVTWTGTWRDPRSAKNAGNEPENSLLGNIFTVNGRRDDSLRVPAAHGRMRLWRDTPLASMGDTATYTFKPGTLGYEWNSVEDNGFQPPGVAQLSRTTVTMDGYYVLKNHGDEYGSGTKTHAITYYKAPSGALVFGAGTVQWAWGVDDEHAFQTEVPTSDRAMKQATVNFLADMGVQPATLQADLKRAAASTDTAAPTAAITGLPAGAVVGVPYTFSGTVSDNGGGRVAGVEVSTDGGARWHPASWTAGSGTWSHTHAPSSSGAAGLRVRAVDDSANLSAPVSAAPPVRARTCPCGIWTGTATPQVTDSGDASALELGTRFTSATAGHVRGVRFYKSAANTGRHTGSLWSATGERLATGTFSGETASGWQTLTFPSPVAVAANTSYVVSYFAPNGHYAVDVEYFARQDRHLEPLTAPRTATGAANGVYRSGTGFPTQSFQGSNYWVDVVWALDPGPDTRAPELTGTTPLDGAGTVELSPAVTASFDEAVAPSSVRFTVTGPTGAITGTTTVSQDGKQVVFTPSAALVAGTGYTAVVRVADAAGNEPVAPTTFDFTTGLPRASACPCTVWDDFARPATAATDDPAAIELGTKVRFDGRGEVLGVRFYKGPGNTGTHTGSLWSSTGLLLATGTFTGETTTGWQKLTFASPVVVQPNTTYVVSYFAPAGRYSVTGGQFTGEEVRAGAMRALASGADGVNGLFRYGSGGGFPTSGYNGSNYWVDAIYRNGLNGDTTPPTSTGRTPATGATGVPVTTAVTATFSEPVDPASAQILLTDPGGAKLTGTVSLSGDQRTITWTPGGKLAPSTRYGANVQIADANGNAMAAPVTWSFTTAATPSCPCSLFSPATVPAITSADDAGAHELGVRFTPARSGRITGVKFYRGAENTGTHTGSLWSASGQRLATGTFTGETASGWQTLVFAQPVTVSPGTTYTASYTTTTGHYAVDSGYFRRTAAHSPPLSAPATGDGSPNGVYRTGAGFPTATHEGGNYWVDVVFTPSEDGDAPIVNGRTPLPGATQVAVNGVVTASFDEPVDPTTAQFTVSDPRGARLVGTTAPSVDQKTLTWTPAAPLAGGTRYTASVRTSDAHGNPMTAADTWSFTTTTAQTCPCSLFSEATVPAVTSSADTGAHELGVRLTPSAAGTITGVKFYKGAANTGTHTGSLWTATGELLATGTFTAETASGWQTLVFAAPVPVSAGTTYVASYSTTTGGHALDGGYFEGHSVTSQPLTAPATGETTRNGVYRVGAGFPENSYAGSNYWVDVIFTSS
ncbi:DUF4082 domain-containing protein [Umezawaea beigongshangensis]|uniref:DUF4082 domain-containing protein n=1 Tax=Umezawaea beigongshangensis TaxID=2780383 RepID=UPI0018F22664|nr:DUF4082 domain-containing protein [Umezawaea beigongshangensis]